MFNTDYSKMRPVKIVPDDDYTPYMWLVVGICIGFILSQVTA